MRWRHRLLTNEFPPGLDRDLMGEQIADALAEMLDCDPRDIPGRDLCPDTPEPLWPLR